MSPTIDPSKLKVTELREELQARGLDTKGNKPVLVKRLKKALEEELNKELPDTSIADTSTEDLDASCTEEKPKVADEPIAPDRKSIDSRTSQEQGSDAEQSIKKEEPEEPSVSASEGETGENPNLQVKEETQEPEVEEQQENNVEVKKEEEIKNEESTEVKDVEMSEVSGDTQNEQKGEKRKRSDASPDHAQKRRERSPIKEDEPDIDPEKVLLSWYDSDLHLQVDKESFLSAKPIHDGLFGYAWAGVRASHGVSSGKVRYEVKITEEMKWEDFTYQRRERQEKAKERQEREKQKQQSKIKKINAKDDTTKDEAVKDDSGDKNEDKVDETEKMDVTETESSKPTEESPEQKSAETETVKTETETVKTETAEELKEEVQETEDVESETQDQKEESAEPSEDTTEPIKIQEPVLTHIFRTGWSLSKANLQLGEDSFSYGYESTGKFVANKEFKDFAAPYKLGDVVGAYLNITADSLEMRYTVNGDLQLEVISIPRSELPEEDLGLFPHVLSRNFGFELNLGAQEEPWFPCPADLADYPFLQAVEDKVQGPTRPEKKEDCEVVMMCGLPYSGKTFWVKEYLKSNADKKITVIGSSHLLDKMTVHGHPLKSTYNGRWNILLDKLQRCLNRLADIAPQRRRNYVIDQTNVFPSAQRRKLRAFEGFKRRAVVVVVGDEEQAKRESQKDAQGGNDVPDYTILEMKANMVLPTQGDMFDEVIYTDLNEEEAKAQVAKYNTEGKAAGYQPGQKKPSFRDDRSRWNYKRNDYGRGGGFRDRGFQRFDRGPRGWGHPPPPGRFPRDRRPLPPPMDGGRDWMRNNRGPPRPGGDRNGRDSRPPTNFNRNRSQGVASSGGRPGNWQSGGGNYGQGNWGQQQGNWGGSGGNQGWGSGYQQSNWNANQWKYGGNNQQGNYGQQGYGQNWNNYYGQYAQNWTGQGQQGAAGSNQYNQYAQWAQYAQQYAQGQNAKHANNAAAVAKK